ncbi:MAG: DUF3108 domain-containing protein [Balneola sp.]|nr:MAG: DUF3108 domain-containing protein [Balneola sp.]
MRRILLLLLFLSVSEYAESQENAFFDQPTFEKLVSVKETFRYEVKYGFFKLGWVEVTLLSDTLYNGRVHQHLITKMESNSKIPFMGTEIDHYHSFFYENEDGIPVTSLYWKDNLDEEKEKEIIYSFDRETNSVAYKEEDGEEGMLDLIEPATAGHIIFYFSRLFAGGDEPSSMPVYIAKGVGYIHFENSPELEKRKYRPFGKIEAYMTRGKTENLEGPFGFSGDFRAWFLNDDLRVPLEARVKVFLGNAIIKLIEYEKEER